MRQPNHAFAATLLTMTNRPTSPVDMLVPFSDRRPAPQGVTVHRTGRLIISTTAHGVPTTTVNEAPLDLVATARTDRAALVREMCGEVGSGVRSPLERTYRRDVEAAHGVPRPTANNPPVR